MPAEGNDNGFLISLSLITAGGANWFFDWLFLYGHGRIPAMGIAGSGWATVVVRCWMLLVLLVASVRSFRERGVWPRWGMLRPNGAGCVGCLV